MVARWSPGDGPALKAFRLYTPSKGSQNASILCQYVTKIGANRCNLGRLDRGCIIHSAKGPGSAETSGSLDVRGDTVGVGGTRCRWSCLVETPTVLAAQGGAKPLLETEGAFGEEVLGVEGLLHRAQRGIGRAQGRRAKLRPGLIERRRGRHSALMFLSQGKQLQRRDAL